MTIHEVKSWPSLFQPAIDGRKTHDIRNANERIFSVGDEMMFREFCPSKGEYTGRKARFRITYITSPATPCALSSAVLVPGYCVLSIQLIEKDNGCTS